MTREQLFNKVREIWVQWGGMAEFANALDDLERSLPPEAAGTVTIKRDLWDAVCGWLEATSDVRDGGDGRHLPNGAMILLQEIASQPNARPEEGAFEEALELLRSMEFVTVLPSKCPVCLGFEMPHGEQSKHHTKKCRLAAFLKRFPPRRIE